MQRLTCPVPGNINPLQSNGFMFSITKYPEIQFFCQEANLPSLDLPPAEQVTPLVDSPHPGDKMSFGDLSITFLIDEDMANYKVLYDWIVGLGFPESRQQFDEFVRRNPGSLNPNNSTSAVSDGVLQILGSSNTPVRTVMFKDLFPVAVAGLQMQSTTNDTTYLAAQATFKYTLFELS